MTHYSKANSINLCLSDQYFFFSLVIRRQEVNGITFIHPLDKNILKNFLKILCTLCYKILSTCVVRVRVRVCNVR